MTTDVEVREEAADTGAAGRRIPVAVWINRPAPSARRAARVLAAAIVLGLVALALRHTPGEPLVPSAVAGTESADAGGNDGATGYFPDRFDRTNLAPADLPPTF
jgi:hypothetical protein